MPLAKAWQMLNRETLANVPDRYGIYELGDTDGTTLSVQMGALRDELKDVLAYQEAPKVRWEAAQNQQHAIRLCEKHRQRLDR
jgi:hypothetical protein